MCGIAGLFRFQGHTTPEESEGVRRMMRAQTHRGPNDEGFLAEGPALLGHRRLAIVDTSSAGHQPFSDAKGQVHLVYNGEIYNFRDLRRDLESAGKVFRSQTDSEVLLHGYDLWGMEGLLSRLCGMFAFALLDQRSERDGPCLLLARDRFGIKPLYYVQTQEKIIFASEVRALEASLLVSTEADEKSLELFLRLGSVPAPFTTLKAVRSVPAGTWMKVRTSPSTPQAYWDFKKVLQTPPQRPSQKQAVERARQLLKSTIDQHLISDVPLGIFLSGGIDSSALVAFASAARSQKIKTLSIAFDERGYDESAFARRVAEKYHTEHHEVPVRYDQFKANLPKIFAAMDQPTVDGVNTFMISKAAKEAGLTVVLSGLGADELFSGYAHLQKAHTRDAWVQAAGMIPAFIRRSLLKAASPATLAFGGTLGRKMWCLEDISPLTPWWIARGIYSPAQAAMLLGQQEACPDILSGEKLSALSPENRMRYLDYTLYLENQLLKDSDAMSMAHSLELRVPFMDHRLVQGILSMATAQSPIPKKLLIDAAGPDFPQEVWKRPKQGFTFPFAEWMKKDSPELESMALARTPLEKKAVQNVWADFRKGRLHWSRPWMTVVAAQLFGGRP